MTDPVKFLLVDDLPENLLALEALLRRDGLELLKAQSGREALELLLVHDVALAILDVQMPEMDGFELAELMRGAERTRRVPIIFVTAGSRDAKRLFQGYDSGAVDFLFKPIEPHVLRQKAEIFFELYQQRRQLSDQLEALTKSSQEQARLNTELAETLKLAEMFTAVLGHDLRNPLNVVTTSAHLLLRKTQDEDVKKSANRVLSSGQRMARMIDELLDVSRARLAGGFPLSVGQLDLGYLAKRLVADHELTFPDRPLHLSTTGDANGLWDEDRIFQVISNLLANAVHHGKPGTAIELGIDAGAKDQVLVSVRNEGSIPPELLPHVFDPFRSGAGRKERVGGLGLGLFIVKEIVAAHGGTAEVRSTEADGTTFMIRLPRESKPTSRPSRPMVGPAGGLKGGQSLSAR